MTKRQLNTAIAIRKQLLEAQESNKSLVGIHRHGIQVAYRPPWCLEYRTTRGNTPNTLTHVSEHNDTPFFWIEEIDEPIDDHLNGTDQPEEKVES
jgi:hypothetical protein